MIHEFKTLDELEDAIIGDEKDHSLSSKRFPVRFIFLNSHDDLKTVTSILSKNHTKIREIKTFLYSDDSWFTPNQITEEINKIHETSLIIPLSEYIRFLNDDDFLEIFTSLSQIENKNIKIYIPLVGLWDRFNNVFWNNFYRKDNWTSIWKLESDAKKIKIYQINFDLKTKVNNENMEVVSNSDEWFDLWKKEEFTNIISSVNPTYFKNSIPDNTFSIEFINNPKEYLSEILKLNIGIDYKAAEKK